MDRQTIIDFIIANDSSYANVNFVGYNINQLVMIKIKIEIEKSIYLNGEKKNFLEE